TVPHGWTRPSTQTELTEPGSVTLGHKSVQRWNLPDGWVISNRPVHPALVSEDDFVAAQDINAARGPVPQGEPVLRRYLLAGLLACGLCGRRMESAWTNGKPAYRCRHGRSLAAGTRHPDCQDRHRENELTRLPTPYGKEEEARNADRPALAAACARAAVRHARKRADMGNLCVRGDLVPARGGTSPNRG